MQYHVAKNGEKSGPFDKEEVYRRLVAGELSGSDLGWHEGMAEWEPLSKLIPPPTPQVQPVFVVPGGGAVPAVPVTPLGTSGLAIASLVCGILVFLTFGLAGLPAVITGHMALSRIKKSAGALKGGGMAIAGLVMGYLGFGLILVAVLASLAVPVFTMVQMQGMQMKVVNNAKQLVIGMKQYAADHDGKYPPTLDTLFEEQILPDRKLLEFPVPFKVPGQGWEYRGAEITDSSDGRTIVLVTKKTVGSKKKIIARNDGSAEVVKENDVP
jgi:type II secretory pathway pseudopilin PulG